MADSPFEVVTLDLTAVTRLGNYNFLIHNSETGDTCVVDPILPDAVRDALGARGWSLTDILLTHHHDDHTSGVAALREGCRVWGSAADAHRLPDLTHPLAGGEATHLCGATMDVFDVPGHTVGHLAYYLPEIGALFSGDSLMACGCGRLFEGSAAQMWDSLQKLRALPDDTLVYSGHEYTEGNTNFAVTLEAGNPELISRRGATVADRAAGRATVPSRLGFEKATNPFLRVDIPAFQAALEREGDDPVNIFADIRAQKDAF